jgi:hypothetical protein
VLTASIISPEEHNLPRRDKYLKSHINKLDVLPVAPEDGSDSQ